MIKKLNFPVIAGLLLLVTGFSVIKPPAIKAKEIEKSLARVNDSLYMGKYEVTNREFKEFLLYLSQNNQKEMADKYRSDSIQWLNHPKGLAGMLYHIHPAFGEYPVVAISYEAAGAFCDWLTEQYLADPKRKFKKVKFRLPTEAEWLNAAYAGKYKYRYPWGDGLIKRTGEYMAVYRKITDQRITYDSTTQTYKVVISDREIAGWDDMPVKVFSFWPNSLGIYHQSGNVAEMVMEKGIAKGGSFNDPGYDIQIQSKKYYTQTSNEIGFRISMQVIF